jgi:competence protein ComEC
LEKTIQSIPFLRITIALALGISVGSFLKINPNLLLPVCFFLLIIIGFINRKYRFSGAIIFGLLVHLFFLFIGIYSVIKYNQKTSINTQTQYFGVIQESPQEKTNAYKSIIRIASYSDSGKLVASKENIIIYFEKTENAAKLNPGEIIFFKSELSEIKNFNNPYEFDYKKYLERQGIRYQTYLAENNWIKTNTISPSLKTRAEKIRDKLLAIYKNQTFSKNELEILSALTLGYKREIDPETRRVFASAGASHILAVSGLHVGIVYWIISIVFGFLRKFKAGRILFVLLSIVLLWAYAFITGLSPSVMRAATMFSLFVVGDNLNRSSNIYNSLAASAFILLLVNPNNLFDVGFQLSYAAVFGIVFLQPKFEKLLRVENKVFKFFRTLITISFAAQIATFPIITYYFGQFPVFFWLTNIFIIPAAMLLIPLGFSLLVFSKIQIISTIISFALAWVIKITYSLLTLIEQIPFSVYELSFNSVQTVFVIFWLSFIFIFLRVQTAKYLKISLIFLLFLAISVFAEDINTFNSSGFIAYNTPKNQSIHFFHGKTNFVVSEKTLDSREQYFHPGTKTAQKMGLTKPVFLNLADTTVANDITIKNLRIFFEGKTFLFNKTPDLEQINCLPDYLINPSDQNLRVPDSSKTVIIFNKRLYQNFQVPANQIHNTLYKGAFRKKW